jgi:hypothetical protein
VTSGNNDSSRPFFVAYVYPGWHHSQYRPLTNEWTLLDRFEAYFDGHKPMPRPLNGPYDDSQRDVVEQHIDLASDAGISAFSYFLYPSDDNFLLSAPLFNALDVAAHRDSFAVAATWCLRLPLVHFPIPTTPLSFDGMPMNAALQLEFASLPADEKPLELLTPADLALLIGGR